MGIIYAGRIKNYLSEWEKLTNDPFFLQSDVGYQIEWAYQPWQIKVPKQFHMNKKQQKVTKDEIHNVLKKGAIRQVEECPDQFI